MPLVTAVLALVRRLVYAVGGRPRPRTILYSPTLAMNAALGGKRGRAEFNAGVAQAAAEIAARRGDTR